MPSFSPCLALRPRDMASLPGILRRRQLTLSPLSPPSPAKTWFSPRPVVRICGICRPLMRRRPSLLFRLRRVRFRDFAVRLFRFRDFSSNTTVSETSTTVSETSVRPLPFARLEFHGGLPFPRLQFDHYRLRDLSSIGDYRLRDLSSTTTVCEI